MTLPLSPLTVCLAGDLSFHLFGEYFGEHAVTGSRIAWKG